MSRIIFNLFEALGTYVEKIKLNSVVNVLVFEKRIIWQDLEGFMNRGALSMCPNCSMEKVGVTTSFAHVHQVEDYAPYQRLPHAAPAPADYLRASQTPSRQDYCSDPYASVHKPKKRMDQHMGEFHFHDTVSVLFVRYVTKSNIFECIDCPQS